jgi:hypothetical protein
LFVCFLVYIDLQHYTVTSERLWAAEVSAEEGRDEEAALFVLFMQVDELMVYKSVLVRSSVLLVAYFRKY